MKGVGGHEREVEADPSIVKPEFVSEPRINDIGIRKAAGHGSARELIVKAGQVVERGPNDGIVVEPAKTHGLLVRDSMVNPNLMVVVQRRERLLADEQAGVQREPGAG